MIFIILGVLVLLALGIVASMLYVVRQQTVVIIERFGNTTPPQAVAFTFVCLSGLIKLLRVSSCACYNLKSL